MRNEKVKKGGCMTVEVEDNSIENLIENFAACLLVHAIKFFDGLWIVAIDHGLALFQRTVQILYSQAIEEVEYAPGRVKIIVNYK